VIAGSPNAFPVYKWFDINQDGTDDVRFNYTAHYGPGGILTYGADASVAGVNGAAVAVKPDATFTADAIGPAELVGPQLHWRAPGTFEAYVSGDEFRNPGASIGVRLMVNGQPHYGWVSVQFSGAEYNVPIWARLHVGGAAWETLPDTPILATVVPEPGVLGPVVVSLALLARRHRFTPN